MKKTTIFLSQMFTSNCYNVQNRVGAGLSIYKNKIEASAAAAVFASIIYQ